MLDDTGDAFPMMLQAVREFLVPIRASHHWLFGLTRTVDGHTPSSVVFPNETLDLLTRIISDDPHYAPYDLAQVLALIEEADPSSPSDQRFKKLTGIAMGR